MSASRRAACSPIAGRLRVPDRLDRVSVLLEPHRRGAVQRDDARRGAVRRSSAAAGRRAGGGSGTRIAPDVERGDEGVRVLEALQDRLRARRPVRASASGPLTRSSTEVRRSRSRTSAGWRSSTSASRYPATVRSLPENSRRTARDRGARPARSRRAAGRRPTLRSAPRAAPTASSESGSRSPRATPGLVQREAQIGAADLGQRARQPQPMQPEPGVLPRRQHDPQRRGQRGQEALEQAERLGRAQLVQVVDDQHDGPLERARGRTAAVRRPPRRRRPASARSAPPARSSPAAAASASTIESQKRCASCSPRSTDTQASRSASASDSAQERSSVVLPLPAGAHRSATPPGGVVESRSNRAPRRTRPPRPGERVALGLTRSGCC